MLMCNASLNKLGACWVCVHLNEVCLSVKLPVFIVVYVYIWMTCVCWMCRLLTFVLCLQQHVTC